MVVALPSEERRHLARVLRLGVGATVQVFDGHGHEYAARVERADRTSVTVRTLDSVTPVREPRVGLTLAQALLKGRKLDTVVRDATMLGVSAIQPILSEHTEVPPAATARDDAADRWQRIAVASAKQCGRAVVPRVHTPTTLERFVSETREGRRILLVEPTGAVQQDGLQMLVNQPAPDRATIMIGPEGGWADAEIAKATAGGFEPLTLGSRTLRADAAPIAALAVLQFVWGDL